MAELRYIDDAGQLRTTKIGDQHFLIGRAATCQITFVDDMISREHARIDADRDGRFRIRDLGSRNKTIINGELVSEKLLVPGDVIRVGEHVLEYLDESLKVDKLNLDFLTPDRKEPAGSEWIKTKAPVTLPLEQVATLAGLATFMGSTVRAEEIAETALARLLHDLQADRGFIARRGEGKTDLVPMAHRGLRLDPGGSRMPVSQVFVTTALLQHVAGRYPQQASQIDTQAGYAATGLVAPVGYRKDVMGVVYVDRPTARQPFSAMALQYITAAGAAIGGLLVEASQRLADSFELAESAWTGVARRLRADMQTTPAAGPPFSSAWKSQDGMVRCGDLADVVTLGEDSCALIVVDACGSGVRGLAQANAIRTGIRSALSVAADPLDLSAIMDGLNRSVAAQADRQMVTCSVVAVDVSSGRIAYINAGGMPPLLLAGPGRLITLDQPSLVLGIDGEYSYETTTVDLPTDFRIVAFTDGLTDAAGPGGEPFSEQRLHELLLAQEAFTDPPQIVSRIMDAVSTHLSGRKPDDDGTVLVLGRG